MILDFRVKVLNDLEHCLFVFHCVFPVGMTPNLQVIPTSGRWSMLLDIPTA